MLIYHPEAKEEAQSAAAGAALPELIKVPKSS
jgi:hypothetical protein